MSKRKTLSALLLSVSVLATVCALAVVTTAQEGPNKDGKVVLGGIKTSQERLAGIKVDVETGGGAAQTFTTDKDGKIDLTSLSPGKYSLSVAPLSSTQKAANAGEGYNYIAVTISGKTLVGGTKTRSVDLKNWKFVEPPVATARRQPLPNTFAARMQFEIGPRTGSGPPEPVQTTIIKSKSNITNN
jgi:hypothetical protein